MKLPNQDYHVIRHSKPYSSTSDRSPGQMTVTIWFKGRDDNANYKTHIVKGMKNKSQWSTVMDQLDAKPVVHFESGRLSSEGIIDADSTPIIVGTKSTSVILTPPPVPDIFSEELTPPQPLTADEIRGFRHFIQHVEAYLNDPSLLDTAYDAVKEQE